MNKVSCEAARKHHRCEFANGASSTVTKYKNAGSGAD